MAKYWTLEELKTKIQNDTDTEAEDFIQAGEMTALINEAIDEAERIVHKLELEDDYFLTYQNYGITLAQELVDLPSDIYAFKIRGIVYSNGNLIYPIKRFRGRKVFESISNAQHFTNAGDFYKYTTVNDNQDSGATPAPKLLMVPPFRETIAQSATGPLRIWYIRNAHELSADTDICDIPEAAHFIIKFVKHKIFMKESHPNTVDAKNELEQERTLFMEVLATMIPDDDNEVPPDLEPYNDAT